jgi:hypothetical protein
MELGVVAAAFAFARSHHARSSKVCCCFVSGTTKEYRCRSGCLEPNSSRSSHFSSISVRGISFSAMARVKKYGGSTYATLVSELYGRRRLFFAVG